MSDEALQSHDDLEALNSDPSELEPLSPTSEELEALLEEVPEEKKSRLIQLLIASSTSFRGPIPPPRLLEQYGLIVDDGAERIFKMAENQSEHRMSLENHAVKEGIKQSARGQLFGFILGVLGLFLAFILAMYGHETVAGIFGTTTIVGLVAVFVIGKRGQDQDQDIKEID